MERCVFDMGWVGERRVYTVPKGQMCICVCPAWYKASLKKVLDTGNIPTLAYTAGPGTSLLHLSAPKDKDATVLVLMLQVNARV